eukprot:953882-Prorocentrum_minimum.AAC.1
MIDYGTGAAAHLAQEGAIQLEMQPDGPGHLLPLSAAGGGVPVRALVPHHHAVVQERLHLKDPPPSSPPRLIQTPGNCPLVLPRPYLANLALTPSPRLKYGQRPTASSVSWTCRDS